jgi:hypothetical protein
MPILHIFGCSLSSSYESFLRNKLNDYLKFHNQSLPKIWGEILSEKLGYKLNNLSEPSSGNDSIFHKYIDAIDNIKSGDMVIVGWSNLSRFRWISENKWTKKTPSMGMGSDRFTSQQTIDEILINRSHKLREFEVYDYEKIINILNTLNNVETYFWSSDERIINNLPDNIRITKKYLIGDLINNINPSILSLMYGYQKSIIKNETDGLIDDNHFSGEGQIILANLFHQHILKYKNEE